MTQMNLEINVRLPAMRDKRKFTNKWRSNMAKIDGAALIVLIIAGMLFATLSAFISLFKRQIADGFYLTVPAI